MKLLMKSLLAKICFKKVLHEAKLVSILPTNFLLWETNLSAALPAIWRQGCSGEN